MNVLNNAMIRFYTFLKWLNVIVGCAGIFIAFPAKDVSIGLQGMAFLLFGTFACPFMRKIVIHLHDRNQ